MAYHRTPTDWTSYYTAPYRTASYSRNITQKKLLNLIRKYAPPRPLTILELGGANSCFFEAMMTLKPTEYVVVDNNGVGIDLFIEKYGRSYPTRAIMADVLELELAETFDIVYSVGLIEHFSPAERLVVIEKHFAHVTPGGIAIITFPTPTFLYRITRFLAEIMGLWIFHDEVPLPMETVRGEVKKFGTILYETINWSIFLTQGMMVIKKHE